MICPMDREDRNGEMGQPTLENLSTDPSMEWEITNLELMGLSTKGILRLMSSMEKEYWNYQEEPIQAASITAKWKERVFSNSKMGLSMTANIRII